VESFVVELQSAAVPEHPQRRRLYRRLDGDLEIDDGLQT
jgi:hypothetical protein